MTPNPQLAIVPAVQEWIPTEEAMRITGWSAFWLREQAKIGAVLSRISATKSANGRPLREYLAASLPQLAQPATHQLALVGSPVPPLFAGLTESAPRTVLPNKEDQAQAEQRLAILKPILEFPDNPARFSHLVVGTRQVTSVERMIEFVAQSTGKSSRTIKRWLSSLRNGTFADLADRDRSDKGQSRWFKQHPEAVKFVWYLFLVEKCSIAFIWDELNRQLDVLGLTADDLPSRETVRVFLSPGKGGAKISPAIEALARKGERAYREMVAPYVRRGYDDIFANQVWVGDHCIHDRGIQNDFFEEVPAGTPGRLRNSTFIDYRSRYAWSTFAWEGSSRSIAATMLRAMLEVGPPQHIYVDNGKDYKKVAKGAQRGSDLVDDEKAPGDWWDNEYKRIENTGLLARLSIKVTHCLPRHPQSKNVERFFKTMHGRFDAIGRTYTSGSPWTRPELTEKLMMRHRRLLKAGRVAHSDYPTASQMMLDYIFWLEEYNNTPQRGEGMDGRSPREVFEANLNPDQKPVPEPKDLVLLMAEFSRRQVQECAVRLNNYRYTPAPADRAAWFAMHEVTGTEILVAWNPEDPEYAAALDLNGRMIAWLEAEELLPFAPGDGATQKKIGASFEMRRGLEKAARQSLAIVESSARAIGVMSPEESLRSRHQLPANAGIIASQRKPKLAPTKKAQAPKTRAEVARELLGE